LGLSAAFFVFFSAAAGAELVSSGFHIHLLMIVVSQHGLATAARLIAARNTDFGVESAPFLRSKVDPQIERRDP
jgi:hypothetical protein